MKKLIPLVAFGGFLLAGALACGSGDAGGGAAEVADDGSVKIPNSKQGFRAIVPEGTTPNGIGGAAGFHTDDDSFSMVVRESSKQGRSKADHKTEIESFAFGEWISEADLEDGYALAYVIDLAGKKSNSVAVVRKIDGTDYECTGSSTTPEGTAAIIDACKTVRK